MATGDARGCIVALKSQLDDLTLRLAGMRDKADRASERASVAESRRDEALAQLSSLEYACRKRNEARAQCDEAWAQCEVAKVQWDEAQAHCEVVMAQREEAVARVVVLEQELSKHIEDLKSMVSVAEKS